MRMSLVIWTLLLPTLSASACLTTPGRASLQDAGDPGLGDADLAADASEAGPPDQDAAWDDGGAVQDDAPRLDEAPFDVPPDEQADAEAPETVAPTLVRCVGRAGSGGLVGGNGKMLTGFVGAGVRALRVGK
jgi:hypothetical protein